MKAWGRWLGLLLLALTAARAAETDPALRLVIVANSRQPESVALAHYYAERRGVPAANIVALPLPEAETVPWRVFVDEVWQPLQDELYRRGWIEGTASSLVDRFGRKRYAFATQNISYLVTCRGVPLRVANDAALIPADSKFAPQFNRNESAVDAEFALLATGNYDITGLLNNPLYAQDGRLSFEAAQVIKVTRLDGPTWAAARRLVDSALEGERRGLIGRYYVDLKGPHSDGDDWLGAARRQLDALGFDGDVEDTGATLTATARSDAAVFYFGWYAGQLDGPFAAPGFAFAPGAVALHIHSYSAHTLHSETAGWCGPLTARGVAATVGNVYEPYLQLTHRPDMLLRALARGRNFGDAAYYALPVLSWQAVALGDPLYRPFHVTLDAQLARLDQLPPIAARYVLVRSANLQARQGQLPAAIASLRAAQERRADLVVGLGLAQLLLENRDPAGAVAALGFARRLPQFAPTDWAVARSIAQFLSAQGEAAGAVEVFTTLLKIPALTEAEQLAILGEAQAAAVAAGDAAQAAQFGRRRAELVAPVSNVP
jgi:uncharacterized protein (TIGR03790 family)